MYIQKKETAFIIQAEYQAAVNKRQILLQMILDVLYITKIFSADASNIREEECVVKCTNRPLTRGKMKACQGRFPSVSYRENSDVENRLTSRGEQYELENR